MGQRTVLLTTEVYVEGEKADDTFYWFNYQQKQGCLLALPGTTLTCNVKEGHAVISNTGDVPQSESPWNALTEIRNL